MLKIIWQFLFPVKQSTMFGVAPNCKAFTRKSMQYTRAGRLLTYAYQREDPHYLKQPEV